MLQSTADEAVSLALWRDLLSVKGAGPALAKALPKTGIPQPVARAGMRVAREGGRSEPDLVLALTRGSGLDEEEAKVRCDQEKAARGAFVTEEAYAQCMDCHQECGDDCRVSSDAVPQFTCPAE